MERIQKSIMIHAPVTQAFEFLAEPRNLPDIWPSLIEVSNLDEAGQSWDWTYKMAGMHFHGHSRTIDVERNRLRVVKAERGISSTFTWRFGERDDGSEVSLDVEYELPVPLLSRLAAPFLRRLNEREAETMLANLKERLESADVAAQPGASREPAPPPAP